MKTFKFCILFIVFTVQEIHVISIDVNQCELTFSDTICPQGNNYPILLPSVQQGLRGFWDFEDNDLINLGEGNIVEDIRSQYSQIKRGPSFIGDEKSAYFDGNNYIQLEHNKLEFNTQIWTYSMWIFFIRDGVKSQRSNCPIFQKGTDQPMSKIFERYPAIYFDQQKRLLQIYIDLTSSDQDFEKQLITSTSRIQYNRWIHISIVNTSAKVKLYINGILDNLEILQSLTKFNTGPLYIGAVPWLKNDCQLQMLVDKFSFYNKEVLSISIQAESQPVLGMVEAASLHLGCISCSYDISLNSCIKGFHLCTSMEIYSGVYNVIRQLGWIEWDSNLWTLNMINKQDQLNVTGTAICCID